jgi:hypothetical protein
MRKFVAANGESLVALNDIQAEAMINGGLTEVFESEVAKPEVIEGKAPARKKK